MRIPAAVLILVACACSSTEYSMDRISDTVQYLRVKKVKVGKSSTDIVFTYETKVQARSVGVHPAGHVGAFAIIAPDKKIYKLTAVSGIAALPDRTRIEQGETLEFKLSFEPIPPELKTFDVGEGTYTPDAGESSWYFSKVKLG